MEDIKKRLLRNLNEKRAEAQESPNNSEDGKSAAVSGPAQAPSVR
jgi:hypothetical protein